MKILIFEWATGTFTYTDIVESFRENGVDYKTVSYAFSDKNNDAFFEYRFSKIFDEEKFDAVFSVNYFPLVSKCCEKKGIKYLSWCYDNPLDVIDIELTLGNSCNYVFMFDRLQVEGYRQKGFDNVYHLPLAANCRRLESIKLTDREKEIYSSQISFVGKMYDSMLAAYMSNMDDFCRGYVDSIIQAQGKIYGYYLIDEMLTDDFMNRINLHFKEIAPDTSFVLPKEALSYAMAAQVTRNERLVLLSLLSAHYSMKYYSWEPCDILKNAIFMGSCDYLNQMPKVFKASKINMNITLKILKSGIPLRVMDILGAGGFVLSNYQPELAEYFNDGQDIVMYESIEDAYAKAKFYLEHDDIRKEIAINGHDKVKQLFSYKKQLGEIFEIAQL